MLLNFAIEIDIQTEENPIVTRFLERWKTRVEKERERRARAESIRYPVSTIHFWFGDSGLGCNENSRIEDSSTNKERIIVPINKRV